MDLNIKHKAIKLEENTEGNLCDYGLCKNSLHMTPKAKPIKEKFEK